MNKTHKARNKSMSKNLKNQGKIYFGNKLIKVQTPTFKQQINQRKVSLKLFKGLKNAKQSSRRTKSIKRIVENTIKKSPFNKNINLHYVKYNKRADSSKIKVMRKTIPKVEVEKSVSILD